jgi:hypothetical protein
MMTMLFLGMILLAIWGVSLSLIPCMFVVGVLFVVFAVLINRSNTRD